MEEDVLVSALGSCKIYRDKLDKINLSTGKPEENPTLLIKYNASSASADGGSFRGVQYPQQWIRCLISERFYQWDGTPIL